MQVAIPKHIKLTDDEFFKFWDSASIYNYIKNTFKYTENDSINSDYKLFKLEDSNTIEFMIYTKKFNKDKLLDFFTYKKIYMIQVQDIADEPIDENIAFTDNMGNETDLLRIILDDDNFVYKCCLRI